MAVTVIIDRTTE